MDKKKAIICTILYVVVLIGIMAGSLMIKNEYGISLYNIITGVIANIWIGCSVEKFYKWLRN